MAIFIYLKYISRESKTSISRIFLTFTIIFLALAMASISKNGYPTSTPLLFSEYDYFQFKADQFLFITSVLFVSTLIMTLSIESFPLYFANSLMLSGFTVALIGLINWDVFTVSGRLSWYGDVQSASYVVSASSVLFYLKSRKVDAKLWRVIFMLVSALLFSYVIFTGSRGPLLSLIITLIIVSSSSIYKLLFTAFTFLLIFFSLIGGNLVDRLNRPIISSQLNRLFSDEARTSLRNDSIDGWLNQSIFGVGWGNFKYFSSDVFFNYPHNVPLEVLVELGLLGFMAFSGILYFHLKMLFVNYVDDYVKVSICVWFVHSLVSGDLTNRILWISIAVSLGISRRKNTNVSKKSNRILQSF
jgi:O-antigen ligase